jgi:hypothetical protein
MIDQFIPTNPASMGQGGYESDTPHQATTGAETVELDGILIDSPEAVVQHMESVVFAGLEQAIATPEEQLETHFRHAVAGERQVQERFGTDMLKCPYGGFFSFPALRYGQYGYVPYFSAYALYPEVMERDFRLQAQVSRRFNVHAARAIHENGLPAVLRLDHDMADSRGTLVRVETLDEVWFPHFADAIAPLVDTGIRLLWHCDGNLSTMVPRLIECGIRGFQGFQYEDGMDYPKICALRDRNGEPLMIWAGVSVTRTLPLGTSDQVRDEIRWLVEHGPELGMFLACSSSITPGIPRANLRVLAEGLAYYRTHGRT